MKYSIVKHLVAGNLTEFVRAAQVERLPMEIKLTANKKFYEIIHASTIAHNCVPDSFSMGSVNELKFHYAGFYFHIKEYTKMCRAQFKDEKNGILWD